MKRSKPLRADPAKAREWQARAARKYQATRRSREPNLPGRAPSSTDDPPSRSRPRPRKKGNDSAWRAACIEAYGAWCRVPGCAGRWIQMDHMKPRSQGGPSVVENGLPLCEEHHRAKTEARLLIDPAWLTDTQKTWLAAVGWVAWDDAGQPYGEGWKHFAPEGPGRG